MDALAYPTRGDTAEEGLLGGWILLLVSLLVAHVAPLASVAPLVPVAGYLVTALGTRMDGADGPPPFRGPRTLVRRGLGALAVVAIYAAVPAVVLAVTADALGASNGVVDPSPAGTLVVLSGSTVVLFAVLAFAYLLPAALSVYARADVVRPAFDRTAVADAARDARYFYAWVVAATVAAFGAVLASAAGQLPRVGPVVAPLVGYYALLVAVGRVGGALASRTGSRTSER